MNEASGVEPESSAGAHRLWSGPHEGKLSLV